MENNYFKYKNSYYHQIRGTAMGCNAAPCIANLYVASYEYVFFRVNGFRPRLYVRFIDDIFFIWEGSKDFLTVFMQRMNDMCPYLKFTFKTSAHSIDFMDMNIHKGNGFIERKKLDIKPYSKSYNPYLYTNPKTYAPKHLKYNWISAETLRLIRISSCEDYFTKAMIKFEKHLKARNYESSMISRQMARFRYRNREQYLRTSIESTDGPSDIFRRIFIRNIPGRHIVTKYLYSLSFIKNVIHGNQSTRKVDQIVITKGKTILDYGNSASKRILRDHTSIEVLPPEDN